MEQIKQFSSADLVTQLKNDIDDWLKSQACLEFPEIFSCEADFQQRLCNYLSTTGKYERIFPEFKVPFELVKDLFNQNGYPVPSIIFPWKNDIRLDLVVKEKGMENYSIIELKYATKEILAYTLFGETFKKQIQLLKNHDASNLVMYNYWKDVRRIEMLCRNFKNVIGGLTILVTNSEVYLNKPMHTRAAYAAFSTYQGHDTGDPNGSCTMNWSKDVNVKKDYPEFIIDGFYKCVWNDSCFYDPKIENGIFRFLINEIRTPKSKFWTPYHILIDKTTTVGELADTFYQDFGLRLKIKLKNRNAEPEVVLIDKGAKTGKIEFRSSITTGRLEQKIKDKFNLDVAVFTKDAWVKVLPDITLSSAGQIPAGATKAKMEKFRSYKRNINS